jgi:hypothetical protein
MKYIKCCLGLSSILGLLLGSYPAQAKPLIQDVCQQLVGETPVSKVIQVGLVNEPTVAGDESWSKLAQNLGLERAKGQEDLRWNCKYAENGKWFSLFDISVEEGDQVIASTFLLNGKFKPNQKDAAVSFFATVISQTLSLGEENEKRVGEALTGYLTLIAEGAIVPDQLDPRVLSQKLQDLDISLIQIPSMIPDGWLSQDAIPVDKLVIVDGGGKPQAVAFIYMVPIIDLEKKKILQWGINITIGITTEQKLTVKPSL